MGATPCVEVCGRAHRALLQEQRMSESLSQWLALIEARHPKAIDMGLERVREVAVRMSLGKPARHVITVAGTNGKGSTVAFIEAIARAAGWKVGAYTSPHLLAYNERVRIDGKDADDASLVAAFEAVEAARLSPSPSGVKPHGLRATSGRAAERPARCAGLGREAGVGVRGRRSDDIPASGSHRELQHPPSAAPSSGASHHLLPQGEGNSDISLTYFETGTLAALWLFERSGLDLAVLEVGLGGRLDATNLVDPDVAVITTVDLDHQDWLGEDREAIGLEKAGIARAWKPLVLGEDDPPASVLRRAYAIGASAIRAGSDFFFEPCRAGQDPPYGTWRWWELGYALELPMPRLSGPVQLRNAATAIAALRALDRPLPDAAIASGVANADVAARLQAFERDGVAILVDVGHNPQAARALAETLQASSAIGRTFAVYAALADKDPLAVVAAIGPAIDGWLLAGSLEAGPRGQDVEALVAHLQGSEATILGHHADVATALQAARGQARAGDRILVFGSFHAAAAALQVLNAA